MTLNFKGPLNLTGSLALNPDGGKVTVDQSEVLVQVSPSEGAQGSDAPPVYIPPNQPITLAQTVWIVFSLNQKVKAGGKPIVAMGMVLQGDQPPLWPGMLLPGSSQVKINHVAINIQNDQAIIFPSGGTVTFKTSGQK